MMVSASELQVGDLVRLNDWTLHVTAVQSGPSTGIRTTEFDFFLQFGPEACVDLVPTTDPADAAA